MPWASRSPRAPSWSSSSPDDKSGHWTLEDAAMTKFIIEPHFRLQEWVAEEKGYFRDEGLDYEFRELIQSTDGQHHYKGDKVGAYQSFERGRESNVGCPCHWTVDVAASKGKGRLYADVYSVSPAGVFVP